MDASEHSPPPSAATLPQIFAPERRARKRYAPRTEAEPFLWREAADGIAARLAPISTSVAGSFTHALAVDGWCENLRPFAGEWQRSHFDERETIDCEGKFDLIVALMGLHTLNDLPGALVQIRQKLKPGGLFLGSLLGGETLHELREALIMGEEAAGIPPTRRIAPFADVPALGQLMARVRFLMAVADAERTCVHYQTLAGLITDLRAMGETGILKDHTPLRRTAWAAAQAIYATQHATAEGRLKASFEIVYLTGWAPGRRGRPIKTK